MLAHAHVTSNLEFSEETSCLSYPFSRGLTSARVLKLRLQKNGRSIVNSVRNSCTVHRNSGVLVKRWFQNHKTVNLRVLFIRINFF